MAKRLYRPLTVSVEPAVEGRLRRLAYENGTSVTAIVAVALERFLGAKDDAAVGRVLKREGVRRRRIAAPG
jgi:predicted transcriptional regulator